MPHVEPGTRARRSKIAPGLTIVGGVFVLATMGLGCLVFSVFSAWKAKNPG